MGSGASNNSSVHDSTLSQQQMPTYTRTVETTTFIDDADSAAIHMNFADAAAQRHSYGYDGVNGVPHGNSRSRNTSYYTGALKEYDDEVELALAPCRSPRNQNVQQNSRRKQQPLAIVPVSNQIQSVDQNRTYENDYDRAIVTNSRDKDDLMFEIYHSDDGREFMVLNDNGIRYYLDSWSTGGDDSIADEWQSFPTEWLQYGWVEEMSRVMSNPVSPNLPMITNGEAESDGSDRMGCLEHPDKGSMTTYFFEEKLNVPCVFDSDSGAWLKLPLSWEVTHPPIQELVDEVQKSAPCWKNRFDILAMLRQCNYNKEEVIMTYLTLMEGDESLNVGTITEIEDDEELQKAKDRIASLEEALKLKDSELKETQEKNSQLRTQLDTTEETAQQFQIELATVKSDLRTAKEKIQQQEEAKPPTPKVVHAPTPVIRPTVSPSTAKAVKISTAALSESLIQIRNALAGGMAAIQIVLKQARDSLTEMKSQKQNHGKEIDELKRLYHKEVLQRKLLYNQLQELRGNIRVFCRCRFDSGVEVALQFPSDEEIRGKTVNGQLKSFQFDKVFSPSSTQEEVFRDTLPLITSTVDGYNVCIMAYGQTGSGKTYTMMGPDSNPGVNVRAIQELLRVCDERVSVDYTMKVSMVEVYNETLRDLLCDAQTSKQQQLTIQMKGKQLVVTDLNEESVKTAEDIKKIMAKGNANRSVGATKMNIHSSRSHLLLMLKLEGHDKVSRAVTRGTLTLVDLAGSERVSKTEATGQRLVEAAAINKSLSALGQVFTALRTNSMHVPYRNSKLTQLLQTALGGDGKTCLFANVSPAESNLGETLSTLQFGSAARQVQLGKATQNVNRGTK